jgi:tetratricopeptide (TPR) repeat protein
MTAIRLWLVGLGLPLILPLAGTAQVPSMSALEREISEGPPAAAAVSPPSSELKKALASQNYERAEQLLADAIARQPASQSLLTQIASVFMLDRKPLNAAIALKKAEALGPLDNPTRLQLALAYIAMKRGDWARPELERLAADEPADVAPLYWLARLDYDAGQYASAIERLQRVVAREPALVRAHDNLALCYEALHQPEEAIGHYREAIRLNRTATKKTASPWPALNLGILLRTRGELDEAEGLFREALALDQRFAPGHYQLGVVLEERRRLADAVGSLQQAISLDEAYAEAYYALSRIYRGRGQAAEADAAMNQFKRLHESGRERSR